MAQTLEQLRSGQLAGITRLKLSCRLTEFPEEIFNLADTLEILDLSGNQLSQLPASFGRLHQLKIVFLSDNHFTEFPEVLCMCPRLSMAGFKANAISFIAEDAIPTSLRWLILTNNKIEQLPRSIGKCVKLQKVMLAGNRLRHLPDEMASCRNMELLRISANQFSEFPEWLFSLPRLSWLALAGNPCSVSANSRNDLDEILWSDLIVKESLGEGASGIISKATWHRDGRTQEVAVKVFKGEVTSDGLPEDEMQACITAGRHPNLVEVKGKIAGHPWQKRGLVLGLIPPEFKNLGGPPDFSTCTRDTYPDKTTFSAQHIVAIASGIASAAMHLHIKGLTHGDLYAHNTLIDDRAFPLFGDFGAASAYSRNDTQRAKAIERIEVRAFGCLLDDLLTRVMDEDKEIEAIGILNQLRDACMKDEVLKRPDFATIEKLMETIKN